MMLGMAGGGEGGDFVYVHMPSNFLRLYATEAGLECSASLLVDSCYHDFF